MRRVGLTFACFACLMTAGTAEARSLGDRPLARGSHGHDVRTLQRALTELGFRTRPADGIFGSRTARSVRRWERSRRLRGDGRVSRREGRRVARELRARRRDRRLGSGGATVGQPRPKPKPHVPDPDAAPVAGAVGPGASGPAVAQAQGDLSLLRFPVAADGVYGEGTATAIRGYQGAFFARLTGVLSSGGAARLHRRALSVPSGPHVFPLQGSYSFAGAGGRYGAGRGDHVHAGQDLAAAAGTPLVATVAGTVTTRAYQAGGAGNYVVLAGDDGFDYVYMHLRKPALIKPGVRVAAGQQLGEVGSTGSSTGPHLHFEIWTAHWYDGGRHFDPLPALLAWR